MSTFDFDVREVAPQEGRPDVMPAGWYKAIITESEIVPGTKDPINSLRLKLKFQIVQGKFANNRVNEGLNIKNPSEKAQLIARSQLASICAAVGVVAKASEQLHNIPLHIKLKITPAVLPTANSTGYEPKNEIIDFRPAKDVVPYADDAPAVAAPVAGVPYAPVVAAAAPWQPPAAPAAPIAVPATASVAQAPAAPAQTWQAPATAQPWTTPPVEAVAPPVPVAVPVIPAQTVAEVPPWETAVSA